MSGKRAAIIGAGMSGIVAIKSFKEEGFNPTCFEKTGDWGGLWKYREEEIDGIASIMQSTVLNTSKEMIACSNFPPPADYANYMHHTQMYNYITMIADKFDCLRHIKYYQETKKIEQAEDYKDTGRWKVTNLNIQTGKLITEIFDCVVVCTGHHVYPRRSCFPNQELFRGKVMHTHSLKKINIFENQRVVVVGMGNSAMDAAVGISAVTKQVYLSNKTGAWILPRIGPNGYPTDFTYLRRYLSLLGNWIPSRILTSIYESGLNSKFDHALYGLKPKHRIGSTHPTFSDSLPEKILTGVISVRGNIKQFTEKGVIFDHEKEETEVDIVILATGFELKFPFLSEELVSLKNETVNLYRFIFPPHLEHPTFGIIGLIQVNGPGLPTGEMQCRWMARISAGRLKLPSKEVMLKDIQLQSEYVKNKYIASERHNLEADYLSYVDILAEEIGAKPNFFKIAIKDPKLFMKLLFGPVLPYQYRLQGPHAWDGAREAILTCEERIRKPFLRPGQQDLKETRNYHNSFAILIVFILLLLYCCI